MGGGCTHTHTHTHNPTPQLEVLHPRSVPLPLSHVQREDSSHRGDSVGSWWGWGLLALGFVPCAGTEQPRPPPSCPAGDNCRKRGRRDQSADTCGSVAFSVSHICPSVTPARAWGSFPLPRRVPQGCPHGNSHPAAAPVWAAGGIPPSSHPCYPRGLLEAAGLGSHAMGQASLGQPDRGYQSWTAVRRVPSPRQPRSPSDGCLPVTRRLAMGDFSQLWMKRCGLFLARLQINRQLHSPPERMHVPGQPCRVLLWGLTMMGTAWGHRPRCSPAAPSGAQPPVVPIWGAIFSRSRSRVRAEPRGGDPHPAVGTLTWP